MSKDNNIKALVARTTALLDYVDDVEHAVFFGTKEPPNDFTDPALDHHRTVEMQPIMAALGKLRDAIKTT